MYYASIRYRNPLFKLGYTLYMMMATLFWARCKRWTGKNIPLPAHLAAVADIYEDCDLVVPVGGGYIRSRQGWANRLIYHCYCTRFGLDTSLANLPCYTHNPWDRFRMHLREG